MKQIGFKMANNSLGTNGKKPVPVFVDESARLVVSCWKMSFRERILTLFTGRIWVCTISDPKNVQPSVLSTNTEKIFG